MMNVKSPFIVIDDSELDCYVTQKFLERVNKNLNIKTFQSAEQALDLIRQNKEADASFPVIILLDLQMPLMSGFKFVEEFEKLPPEVQKNYKIIILTILTSVGNSNDISRILTHQEVNSVIEKPLTKEKLVSLLKQAGLNN